MRSSLRRGAGSGAVPGAARPARRAGPGWAHPWLGAAGTAVAAVGWSFAAMVSVAALGLHLLGADAQGALGPMIAAVVALAVGGAVRVSGDVSVFGITGAGAGAGAFVDIIPLGVSLAGALPLAWLFLRGLRRTADGAGRAALLAAVAALFTAAVAGLAWAGHATVALDGALLGGAGAQGQGPGGAAGGGGGLSGALAELVQARASVGFLVAAGPSAAAGLVWVLCVLALALLFSRSTPLPAGGPVLDRAVRPAASAVIRVLLLAVAAGIAASLYAAIGDPHPGRVVGAALLGAPGAVWAGVSLGLFVPWWGTAYGPLAALLPHPVGAVLGGVPHPVTVVGLAALDGRVWLLPAASGLMMLAAGVLTAVYTPLPRPAGPGRCAALCGMRLAVAGAVAVPLAGWAAGVSAGAGLSVFGVDAVDSAVALHGSWPLGVLLGAGWGAVAGALGALAAWAAGSAGRSAAPDTAAAGPQGVQRPPAAGWGRARRGRRAAKGPRGGPGPAPPAG